MDESVNLFLHNSLVVVFALAIVSFSLMLYQIIKRL